MLKLFIPSSRIEQGYILHLISVGVNSTLSMRQMLHVYQGYGCVWSRLSHWKSHQQFSWGKLLSSVSKPCSPPRKRKRSDMFIPLKKLKMIEFEATSLGSLQSLSTNVPYGTQWENNSCAYDAILTLLFNVWREDPASIQASWWELQSDTLNELLDSFRSHESIPAERSEARYTLDQIREYMRHHLARLSGNFMFGEYTSVDSVLDCLLTSASVVTRSFRFCPRGHDIDMRQAKSSSCHIVLLRHGCNLDLQEYLDDITRPLNATCPVCPEILSRRFTFALHPPLITIELRLHKDPSTLEELDITSGGVQQKYHLRGLIYYAAEHFTACFIAQSGMVWYHDGLLTGRSLVYEGMVLNVIVGLYAHSEWYALHSKELGYATQRDGPLAQVALFSLISFLTTFIAQELRFVISKCGWLNVLKIFMGYVFLFGFPTVFPKELGCDHLQVTLNHTTPH